MLLPTHSRLINKETHMDPQEYLDWRFQFGQVWAQHARFMSLLGSSDQWRLHDFFQFHRDKEPAEALSWFFTIRACDPSVETNALVALKKLQLHVSALKNSSASSNCRVRTRVARLATFWRAQVLTGTGLHPCLARTASRPSHASNVSCASFTCSEGV